MKSSKKTFDKTFTEPSLGLFFALTFALTWGIALLIIIIPDQITAIFGEFGYTNPLYILAVYGPAFAAIFLILRYYGLRGLVSYLRRLTLFRMSFGWWLFLILGIPAHFYFGAVIRGTSFNVFPYEPWYSVLPVLVFMLFLGPVEEFGWRGLALPLLQRRLAPLWSGLVIGVIWGVWHLPAFFMGGTPHYEWVFVSFFVGVIALSVIMTALFNSSQGSILIAALFHFQINNPIWPDAQPWDIIIFSITAVIIVLVYREKMLSLNDSVTGVLMPGEEV